MNLMAPIAWYSLHDVGAMVVGPRMVGQHLASMGTQPSSMSFVLFAPRYNGGPFTCVLPLREGGLSQQMGLHVGLME